MLTTLKNAFKIKEIRQKILFTLGMLVVIRIGSQLPVPGVDTKFFSQWFAQQTGGAFSFFDAITGGSFLNMSILALNINPYITSSIIMQLLTIAIPKLEEMQRDGEDGRKKMVAITRYVTVALALIQSTAMAIGFGRQGYLIEFNALNVITTITALTAGSAFLMWVGERITEKGIGNGISIVLVINIISRLPQDLSNLFEQFVFGKAPATAILAVVIIFAIIIAMVVLVIILNDGVRKIPVQYAKKMQGRKMVGGQTSNIPLKVNTSGVISIIFAISLLQFPQQIGMFIPNKGATFTKVTDVLNMTHPIGAIIYIILIFFFTYFYTSIVINPNEIAMNMKKNGGFIPGIRPGQPTSAYITRVVNRVTLVGAVCYAVLAMVPVVLQWIFKVNVGFGGTTLIIVVGVCLDIVKALESQLLMRHYKGFLND